MITPETRACLDYAFRVVLGFSAEDEHYVLRDGITFATPNGLERVAPSDCGLDALIHLVAKAMEVHLSGVEFAQIRDDLADRGLGLLANKVHDHLVDVSVSEWARLRERVAFYALDNNMPITGQSTEYAGKT